MKNEMSLKVFEIRKNKIYEVQTAVKMIPDTKTDINSKWQLIETDE